MAEFDDKFSETQKSSSIIVNQTYSYINNTGFYALANPVYYSYYQRWARRYAWWYDRFVPDFHNAQQGYFSTGIAHCIVDGIANLIVGKKVLLSNVGYEKDKALANATLKTAYKWADEAQLTSKVRMWTKYGGAIGTSLLKANVKCGEIWLEPLRFDDFFFETGFDGELQDVVCLIKSYTDTKPRSVKWADSCGGDDEKMYLQNKFYLVEHRYFKELEEMVNGELVKHKVPFAKYQVHKYNGNITNQQSWNFSLIETMDKNSLPREILKQIGRDYGAVKLGEEIRLPFFEHLGCELLQYNDGDGSLSQQPFGESILTNIISDLMNFDLAFSYAVRDMYQGKGIVFVPKELQTVASGTSSYQGLEDSMITKVASMDGKLPVENVQFNLRVAEWREKKADILETIATKLQISPSSLASFLSDNTARTAKEVTTESSATDNYIEIQRGCIEPKLNRLLKVIGMFYGWQDEIQVRFGKGGSSNVDTIIDRVIKLVNAGLMHPYEALRQIMVDADEWEVEEAYNKLEAYKKEQQQAQDNIFGSMDFGTQVGGEEYANETK